jgi:hypothetical protein
VARVDGRASGVLRKVRRVASLDRSQWLVVASALTLVPRIQFRMHRHGFRATAEALAEKSDGVSRTIDFQNAAKIADAVAVVAGRRFVGARCLGRSLTTWYLLRRRGMDAVLVIGVSSPDADGPPAHAWVELDGTVVGDTDDVVDEFGSFGLQLPRLRSPSAA